MIKNLHWFSVLILLACIALIYFLPFSFSSFFAGFLMAVFIILRVVINGAQNDDDHDNHEPNNPV